MIIAILIIILGVAYCEFLWYLFNNGKISGKYIQASMKFFIGLNLVMAILIQSYGNFIYAIVILFYYFVLIPQRLFKSNGPVA